MGFIIHAFDHKVNRNLGRGAESRPVEKGSTEEELEEEEKGV